MIFIAIRFGLQPFERRRNNNRLAMEVTALHQSLLQGGLRCAQLFLGGFVGKLYSIIFGEKNAKRQRLRKWIGKNGSKSRNLKLMIQFSSWNAVRKLRD